MKLKILTLLFLLKCVDTFANDNFFLFVDFETSMQCDTEEYRNKYVEGSYNKTFFDKCAQLYEQNNINNILPSAETRIPKIIHQIWVGGKPLPPLYKKLSETWKKMHPDWTYILWTDKEVKGLNLRNKNLYDRAKLLSEKADILRYEILSEFGGVYVDMDFECLKPLDVLNHCYDFYVGIAPNNAVAILLNGLIGSVPQHPIFEMLISEMYKYTDGKHQMDRNGVKYFSLIIFQFDLLSGGYTNIALPATYFYPFKKHYGTKITELDFIRPESFGIHYWGKTLKEKVSLYNQKR